MRATLLSGKTVKNIGRTRLCGSSTNAMGIPLAAGLLLADGALCRP